MAKPNEMTTPDSPTTERALPSPGSTGSAAPPAHTGARAVPGPSERGGGETAAAPARSAPSPRPSRSMGNGRATEPAEMRREIERTRARMSSTLDAIEARVAYERESLERKKDELVDRATLKGVRQKMSREPWRSVAIAFVAGYIVAAIRD